MPRLYSHDLRDRRGCGRAVGVDGGSFVWCEPACCDQAGCALVVATGFVAGIIPACQAYRRSLADGMIVRT